MFCFVMLHNVMVPHKMLHKTFDKVSKYMYMYKYLNGFVVLVFLIECPSSICSYFVRSRRVARQDFVLGRLGTSSHAT